MPKKWTPVLLTEPRGGVNPGPAMRRVNQFDEYRYREMTEEELRQHPVESLTLDPLPIIWADDEGDEEMFPLIYSGKAGVPMDR